MSDHDGGGEVLTDGRTDGRTDPHVAWVVEVLEPIDWVECVGGLLKLVQAYLGSKKRLSIGGRGHPRRVWLYVPLAKDVCVHAVSPSHKTEASDHYISTKEAKTEYLILCM